MPAQLCISFKASKQNYVAINFNRINLIFSSKKVYQFFLMSNKILIYYDTSQERIPVENYQNTWL